MMYVPTWEKYLEVNFNLAMIHVSFRILKLSIISYHIVIL